MLMNISVIEIMSHFPENSLVVKNKMFLIKLLQEIHDYKALKKTLHQATQQQIETLVEISENFLQGNFPKQFCSKAYIKRMLPHRSSLRKLASQKTHTTLKKHCLVRNQKGGALITSLLIPILGSLLSGIIAKKI